MGLRSLSWPSLTVVTRTASTGTTRTTSTTTTAMIMMVVRHGRHAHATLPDPTIQCLQRETQLVAEIAVEQLDGQGEKSLDVLIKVVAREVRVSFQDLDDDGTPCDDVSLLRVLV